MDIDKRIAAKVEGVGRLHLHFRDEGYRQYLVGVLANNDTGEVREQNVTKADVERVRETTVVNRMRKLGDEATPHKLVCR